MQGIDGDPAGLFFAATHDAFVDDIGRALAGPIDRDRLRARARDHDWDGLARRMDDLLLIHAERKARATA